MDKIIECIPNFSTSDPVVIREISNSVKGVQGVKLLNVEPDPDYNRVVVTFVGGPENVGEAAFRAITKATELIDMSEHIGEHPRLGACDVCPFVPVRDVTIDECIQIAKSLAERISKELDVPTYLYGSAASTDERKVLSKIRKGQYEGLSEKILQPEWKPDYGDPVFKPKSGAYVIGVRDFLIAYNVNIDSEDVSIAKEVSELVRESGRLVEKDGEKVRVPGLLKGVQGMGFPLERNDRKLTQASMNIQDFRNKAKLHEAFEEVKRLTEERGAKVSGSEVVGLVPLEAILEAGRFYAPDETDTNTLIDIAVQKMGFSDLEDFIPSRKIIELIIDESNLMDKQVFDFLDAVGSKNPTPGGGSVSALGGSLAAALGNMVANLTIGKEKYMQHEEELKVVRAKLINIEDKLRDAVDEDTLAFNELMKSFRISKEKSYRGSKIQESTIYATKVPLKTAKLSNEIIDHLLIVAEKGNKNAITDVGVAALFAQSAAKGAILNVKINLMSIKDDQVKSKFDKEIQEIEQSIDEMTQKVMDVVNRELS